MNTAAAPLPWQSEPWDRLMAAHAAGRLGQALLLAGPRGVGKRRFAAQLAAVLLCETVEDVKPCGTCRSCVQREAGLHPNLFRLEPAEDKRDIALDDVRDLQERLRLSSHYGQLKIAIVAPADALNANGVNALLKTIEEPPAGTHLVLVSERWRGLPATLRSRCQMIRFAPPPREAAMATLRERFPAATPGVLEPWLRAPLAAPEELGDSPWDSALAELRRGSIEPLKLTERKLARGEARAALERWLELGARGLRSAQTGAGTPLGSPGALQQLLDDCLEGLRALDENNASPALTLESVMIRWASNRG